MPGIIGNADDFYRLRLVRLDEADIPDLDWRDDILYRRPQSQRAQEYDVWRVEAIDENERATVIATFAGEDDARDFLENAEDDLSAMTRTEFEQAYFPKDEGSVEGEDVR